MTNTIFMIHGMWGGAWCWENYQPLFDGDDYHCVTPTLLYHDIDPREVPDERLGRVSLLDYADALEKEISQLGSKPILMGHSLGGLLAQILASRGLAEAVVLLTPATPSGVNGVRLSAIKSFWSVLTTWGFWRKPIRVTFDEARYAFLHLLPPNEQKKMYDRYVHDSGRTVFEIALWPVDPKNASTVDESKITCPMLVVGGAQDRMIPASLVRQVARKYRAVATYKEFDEHGHLVIAEPGWEDVAGYVLRWLAHLPANPHQSQHLLAQGAQRAGGS